MKANRRRGGGLHCTPVHAPTLGGLLHADDENGIRRVPRGRVERVPGDLEINHLEGEVEPWAPN